MDRDEPGRVVSPITGAPSFWPGCPKNANSNQQFDRKEVQILLRVQELIVALHGLLLHVNTI
jgi:hypothetical protein